MYKLVRPFENSRWSFFDGYYVFDFDVYLSNKDDMYKYKLIDDDGNELDVNIEDCLTEY